MVNMNDSGSWAYNFRCYEQLRAMNDMNNFASKLRALNAMNRVVVNMKDFES